MKKVLYSALIAMFCLAGVAGYSQEKKANPEDWARKMTEKMKTDLSLDQQQYDRVYDINLKYLSRAGELRKSDKVKEEKMKDRRELNKQRSGELKEVLTAGQLTRYKDMQKEMRSKSKHRRPAKQHNS